MQTPDFSGLVHHSRQRDSHLKAGIPQALPAGTRLFNCECCNDSGVVQPWKLNRWALGPHDQPLDSTMSLPIFCQMLSTCGDSEMQVFAGHAKDDEETKPRTARVNLLKGNEAGESHLGSRIASGQLRVLSAEQSRYIHNKVLEYRELLTYTEKGRQYVEDVKAACRDAVPPADAQRGTDRLMHIGQLLRIPQMPDEPDWDDNRPTVQVTNPRDFVPMEEPDW